MTAHSPPISSSALRHAVGAQNRTMIRQSHTDHARRVPTRDRAQHARPSKSLARWVECRESSAQVPESDEDSAELFGWPVGARRSIRLDRKEQPRPRVVDSRDTHFVHPSRVWRRCEATLARIQRSCPPTTRTTSHTTKKPTTRQTLAIAKAPTVRIAARNSYSCVVQCLSGRQSPCELCVGWCGLTVSAPPDVHRAPGAVAASPKTYDALRDSAAPGPRPRPTNPCNRTT